MSNNSASKWESCQFDDLCVLQRGFDLPTQNRSVGDVPIIGSNGIVGFHDESRVSPPGVVTGRSGSIGDVLYLEREFWPLNTSLYIKNFKGNNEKFIFYFIQYFDLKRFSTGTGVPTLNRNDVHIAESIKPPLPEQQKIAAILTSVDDVIESTQAQINKLKDLKTGMMQELLTKGIGHTEFKDSAVGRIPKGWDVKKVGELVDVIDPQPDHRTPPEVLDGVPYIGLGDINKDGLINFASARKVSREAFEKQLSNFEIHDGAFIFGKIGTIGNPSILPKERFYCLSANIILLTAKDTSLLRYFYQIFKSGVVNEQVSMQTNTTSQPALGIKKVRDFIVPIPSDREEMLKLVNTFESIDIKLDRCKEKLRIFGDAKKALMQDLLTGKVRVKVN